MPETIHRREFISQFSRKTATVIAGAALPISVYSDETPSSGQVLDEEPKLRICNDGTYPRVALSQKAGQDQLMDISLKTKNSWYDVFIFIKINGVGYWQDCGYKGKYKGIEMVKVENDIVDGLYTGTEEEVEPGVMYHEHTLSAILSKLEPSERTPEGIEKNMWRFFPSVVDMGTDGYISWRCQRKQEVDPLHSRVTVPHHTYEFGLTPERQEEFNAAADAEPDDKCKGHKAFADTINACRVERKKLGDRNDFDRFRELLGKEGFVFDVVPGTEREIDWEEAIAFHSVPKKK